MEGIKMERKPYKSPEIRKVTLVIEEAVLLACKTDYNVPGSGRTCGHPKCQRTVGS
jgi:hypothetical protein